MGSVYVIGVDYGTDSCRALVVDASDGSQVASAVSYYPRWKKGFYCDPGADMYRQHPLDYIESLKCAIGECLGRLPAETAAGIKGISFDTTGSTPALTDSEGTPLALKKGFEENPDAMFILWKDHTAIPEADRINECAANSVTDYTSFSGGTYSAEWVWAKILHVLKGNRAVRKVAYSWIEHCDWMGALLTGTAHPERVRRSRCAAGHKAMWNAGWGGYPSEDFLGGSVDPVLKGWRDRLCCDTLVNGTPIGTITDEWAAELGLPKGVIVGVGALDAHVGAIGAGISPNVLTRIMGTSTCDILVCEPYEIGGRLIRGICGQVDGSVLPEKTGLEAGQSAFGDIYAWFRDVLSWSLAEFAPDRNGVFEEIIPRLTEQARKIASGESSVIALDWMNGRRTPDVDLALKGVIGGLTLGTTPPMIFRALVEATAYGSRAIVERFISEGVRIDSILAIGGIAQKSPFVMQVLSDVLGKPINVVESNQACALGAAICASVAAGIYETIPEAQKAMSPSVGTLYVPDMDRHEMYNGLYAEYLRLGRYATR